VTTGTVYYVRGEGQRNTTSCIFKKVVVDNNSRPASGIQGKNLVCSNSTEKTLLYVVGGKKGLNAKWVWYRNNCNGLKEGEGDSIYVLPTKTTTYFVRAEGLTIPPTNCVSHTLEVLDPSVQPQSISVVQANACANEPVVLSVNGGRLAKEARWSWRSLGKSSNIQKQEDIGPSITVTPDEQTEYFVSAQDDICPSTDETSIIVNVKYPSSGASNISVQKLKRNKYSLSVIGGNLGDKAKWVWYKNGCDLNGKKIASSESTITYKSKKGDNTIYVRAEGECNTSECTSTSYNDITWVSRGAVKKRQNYWYINGGVVAQKTDQINNLVFTLMCRWGYVRAKLALEKGEKYSYNDFGVVESLGSDNNYQFTGKNVYARTSYTGGVLIGGNDIRLYLGGGIGSYHDIKEFNIVNTSTGTTLSTEYARKENGLVSGIEAEGGLFIRLGSISIMGGVSSIFAKSQANQFIDYHISLGFKL
jgi:hypothetical protein